jgi:hypothetical protein
MLRFAIRGSNGSARDLRFGVHVSNDNREGTPPRIRLKALRGPGDDGEPVVTVVLREKTNRSAGQGRARPVLPRGVTPRHAR